MDISQYKTIVFDCDGVILDSNQLKTQAYYDTAIAFGANDQQARALMDYHVKLGGISRYPKFEYFLTEILKQPVNQKDIEYLLEKFASEIHQGLLQCEIAKGLFDFRKRYPSSRWIVLSGGDQQELRSLFKQRQLDTLFDGGIFGSPDDKDHVLTRELGNSNIQKPALFLGDSKYDYQAATAAGLDFIFISKWTEFGDWKEYCKVHDIQHVESLEEIFGSVI